MTEDSPKKVLAAYDAKTGTLSSETILLDCVVMGVADQVSSKVLTNIAYIAEEYNQDYDTIITKDTIQDRDSQTWNSPEVSANNLITEDIGYTGNSSNSTDLSKNDSYYAGEQDDDDFEKIVILPRTFDLKLIKFITDINDKETENRVISVNTDKLNTIGKTTAEYILEKNPVVVKAGDFVTYTLRIYNEGHYDGYAIEISEDIPEGLEFIGIKDGVIYSWDGTKEKDITKEIQASNMHNKIVDINSNWNYAKGSKVITTKALSD